jgi:hydroxymethylpyrimidine/phosphomethylpyrimidine kinase
VAAIKTGLLFTAEVVEVVAATLEKLAPAIPLIVDPVMVATSGDTLLQPEAIELYRKRLFPRATLITPNMAEATVLSGQPVRSLEEMQTVGQNLAREFATRVLLKGGHLKGGRAIDLLLDNSAGQEFAHEFISGVSTHGTGCTYSAAITAGLALGDSLEEAVLRGKQFVSRAIAEHFAWPSPSGEIHALNPSVFVR